VIGHAKVRALQETNSGLFLFIITW